MSLSPITQQFVEACARRQLAGPLLLFAASHRPLAFACGQTLHLLHPVAALLGTDLCGALAADLSAPDAARRLEDALARATQPAKSIQ